MFNIKRLLQHLHPQEKVAANFVLHQDRLFSKKRVDIKHDRIRFDRKSFTKSPSIQLVDLQGESFYLLLIHVDNIAHFFHDVFFLFIMSGVRIKNGCASPLTAMYFNSNFWNRSLKKNI